MPSQCVAGDRLVSRWTAAPRAYSFWLSIVKWKTEGIKKRQASLADVLFSSQSPHFHLCVFFLPATTSNEKTCVYAVEQTRIWTKALGISQDVLPTNRKGGSDLFGFSFYVVSFILIHALEIIFSKKNWEKKKKKDDSALFPGSKQPRAGREIRIQSSDESAARHVKFALQRGR